MSQKKKRYKLIIDIEGNCKDCPYYEEDEWDNELKLCCKHPDNQIVIDKIYSKNERRPGFFIFDYNYPKIPETCPLEDVNE